jgi:UrcA family protein
MPKTVCCALIPRNRDFKKPSPFVHRSLLLRDHWSRAAERLQHQTLQFDQHKENPMKMFHLMVPAMLVAGLANAGTPANQTLLEIPRITVSYDDVNIASPRGADVVLARIVNAARQVCTSGSGIRGVREAQEIKQCVRTATQAAVREINAPQLTALFQQRAAKDQIA